MFPATSNFKAAIRDSHTVITKVEVIRDDLILAIVYPESGSVDVDMRRSVRRTCSLTFRASSATSVIVPTYNTYVTVKNDYATYTTLAAVSTYASVKRVVGTSYTDSYDAIIPTNSASLLTPYGNELKIYRGIQYQRRRSGKTYASIVTDYSTYTVLKTEINTYDTLNALTSAVETVDEYIPLGVFRIMDVDITVDDQGVALTVTGVDRASRISRARWTEPYKIDSGTAVETALADLLANRWTDITTSFTTTGKTTTQVVLGVDTENDPWKDAVDIADAASFDLYFDNNGICVLSPARDYTNVAADETYTEGDEAMLLTAARRITAEDVYNAVIVTGEGTEDTQYRSTALDDDPSSPTYVYGPFGLVPTFRSSPMINSQASADAYAATTLNSIKGTTESISWGQIVDPTLDAGDAVTIINTAGQIARTLIIDKLTVPLTVTDSMGAIARTIRTIDGVAYLSGTS